MKINENLVFMLFIGIFLILFLIFILFWESNNIPIPRLIENNAVLASGVNFDTKKLVVLDPKTGKVILPCVPLETSKNYSPTRKNLPKRPKHMKNDKPDCVAEIINTESNPELNSAIKSSQEPIQGQVKKDGEIIPAQYVVTVEAQFQGSQCGIVISGGDQTQNCTTTPGQRPRP